MKGNDLIASSLRLIGVLASGETVPADQVADAQVILNQMLEAWSVESLDVFTLNILTFNFVASQQAYTMGTGGNFNTTRPPKIEYASIVSNSSVTQPLELPIDMLTDSEWQDIPVKNTPSTLPRKMYDDGGFPLRTLSFWPVPTDSSVQVRLYVWAQLSQFTDLTTDFTFPPGYLEAIKYNFAVRLSAEWPGNISPLAVDLASKALARIKAINSIPPLVKCDPAITRSGGARFNWLTGE